MVSRKKPVRTQAMLALAVLFLLYSVVTATPGALAQKARDSWLAAASLSVSVAPNPYNTVAQQLAQKQQRLDQEEASIKAQQQSHSVAGIDLSFYSLCMSALLFILVAINFYFDIRRRNVTQTSRYAVDLR